MRAPEYLMCTKHLSTEDHHPASRHQTRLVPVQVEFTDHFGSISRRKIDVGLLKLLLMEAVDQQRLLFMSFVEWTMRLLEIQYPTADGKTLIRVRKIREDDGFPSNRWRTVEISPGASAERQLMEICDEQVATRTEEKLQKRSAERSVV